MGCTYCVAARTVVETSDSVGRAKKHRLNLKLDTYKCRVTSDCVGRL